jgi:hypothetical protein
VRCRWWRPLFPGWPSRSRPIRKLVPCVLPLATSRVRGHAGRYNRAYLSSPHVAAVRCSRYQAWLTNQSSAARFAIVCLVATVYQTTLLPLATRGVPTGLPTWDQGPVGYPATDKSAIGNPVTDRVPYLQFWITATRFAIIH